MKTIIQYCQHPDKVGCTYYTAATALANDCGIVLSEQDLKNIAIRMLPYKTRWKKSYNQDTTNKVVTLYVKEKYGKDIVFKKNTSIKDDGKFYMVGGYISSSYVFDIKDGVLESALPKSGESHARCVVYQGGEYYIVENFKGILPYNIIRVNDIALLQKGVRLLTYTVHLV